MATQTYRDDDTVAYVRRLYASGDYSLLDLVRTTKIPKQTIANWLVGKSRCDAGGPIFPPAFRHGNKFDLQQAIGLRACGWKVADIAEHMRVSKRTIRRWLHGGVKKAQRIEVAL
jgi:DNA-binding NarL/FixJ family response regulator